jgi:hypothetical protein
MRQGLRVCSLFALSDPYSAARRWTLDGYLRGGHRLPSRVGVWDDLRLVVVRRIDRKVRFKYRQREIFPFLSLAQQRAALKGTEGRGLTVQRSYRAILAHVFQDDFPTCMHDLTLPCLSPCLLRLLATTIFDFVSGLGRKPAWFPNSDCLAFGYCEFADRTRMVNFLYHCAADAEAI